MNKPYRVEIKEDGEWVHYFNEEILDAYDYRQKVAAWSHEQRLAADKARGEAPLGTYITWTSSAGVRHPQLAKSIWDNSPSSKFYSFKDLETKAAATGQVCNRTRD